MLAGLKVSGFLMPGIKPPQLRLEEPLPAVIDRLSEYGLPAVPVVDDAGRLLGIVTVDDAIDVILPNAWKKRLPRTYH